MGGGRERIDISHFASLYLSFVFSFFVFPFEQLGHQSLVSLTIWPSHFLVHISLHHFYNDLCRCNKVALLTEHSLKSYLFEDNLR